MPMDLSEDSQLFSEFGQKILGYFPLLTQNLTFNRIIAWSPLSKPMRPNGAHRVSTVVNRNISNMEIVAHDIRADQGTD
jgi:hypothetical protein